jgi:hypothetical protein
MKSPEDPIAAAQRVATVAVLDRICDGTSLGARRSRPKCVRELLERPDLRSEVVSAFLYKIGPNERLNSAIPGTKIKIRQLAEAALSSPVFEDVGRTHFSPFWPLLAPKGAVHRLPPNERLFFSLRLASIGFEISWRAEESSNAPVGEPVFRIDWPLAVASSRTWHVLDKLAILGCLYQARLRIQDLARAATIRDLACQLLATKDVSVALGSDRDLVASRYESMVLRMNLPDEAIRMTHRESSEDLGIHDYCPLPGHFPLLDSVAWLHESCNSLRQGKRRSRGEPQSIAHPIATEELRLAWASGTGTELAPTRYPVSASFLQKGGRTLLVCGPERSRYEFQLKRYVGQDVDERIGRITSGLGFANSKSLEFPHKWWNRLLQLGKSRRKRAMY